MHFLTLSLPSSLQSGVSTSFLTAKLQEPQSFYLSLSILFSLFLSQSFCPRVPNSNCHHFQRFLLTMLLSIKSTPPLQLYFPTLPLHCNASCVYCALPRWCVRSYDLSEPRVTHLTDCPNTNTLLLNFLFLLFSFLLFLWPLFPVQCFGIDSTNLSLHLLYRAFSF